MVKKKKDHQGTNIDGGFVDAYVAGFYSDQLTEGEGIRFSGVIDHQAVYGFTTSNRYSPDRNSTCFFTRIDSTPSF